MRLSELPLALAILARSSVGQAGGEFAVSHHPVGDVPTAIAAGDLDGDGLPELVVADFSSDDLAVLRGLGSAAFAPASFQPVGDGPNTPALGDLDLDGDLDAVVAHTNSSDLRVLLGDGAGALSPPLAAYASQAAPLHVELSDVDQDGDLDAVAILSAAKAFSVRLGGAGVAFGAESTYALANFPIHFELGDLDTDGLLDAMVAMQGPPSGIPQLLNQGGGIFAPGPTAPILLFSEANWVALGDLDLDGDLDDSVVSDSISFPGLESMETWIGDGAAGWCCYTVFGGLGQRLNELVDVNGDTFLDHVAVYSTWIAVRLGKGNGKFFDTDKHYGVGAEPRKIAVADLDIDGSPDLVTALPTLDQVAVLRNLLCGPLAVSSITPAQVSALAVPPQAVTLGGCGFSIVTSVHVDGLPLQSLDYSIVSDQALSFTMPVVDQLGPVDVTLTTPTAATTAQVQVVAPDPPALDLGTDAPFYFAFTGLGLDAKLGGSPGSLAFLLYSGDAIPSTLPGVIDLGIGNGFASLGIGPSAVIPAQGWAPMHVSLAGVTLGLTFYAQVAVLDPSLSLPIATSSIQWGFVLF